MERSQKEHIVKNIVRLVECTENDIVWHNHLLEQHILTQTTLDEIGNHNNKTIAKIRKTYLECLKISAFDLLIQTLKLSENDLAANILEEIFATSPSVTNKRNKSIWFGMQSLTKHYKGREEELQAIHNCWIDNFSADSLAFVSITGLGGIGKSELARKYAYKFYMEVQGHCIWINAENDRSFTNSFQGLATKISISLFDYLGKEKTLDALLFDVFKFLAMENFLMVFDNLENYEEDFFQVFLNVASKISPMQTKPFVIVTSRYQLGNTSFECMLKQLKLSVLPVSSAVSYFKNALNIPDDKVEAISDLEYLCQELDYFPLAMQQAAAYIKEMQRTSDTATEIKEYLNIFKLEANKSKALLSYPVPKYQNRDSFSKPIYLTWQITLDKFKLNPQLHSIINLSLNIISFFPSGNISVTFLKSVLRLAVSASTDIDLTFLENGPDVFETLRNYSMCRIDVLENDVYLSVHRLVQAVSQIKLKEDQKWAETLNMLIQSVNDSFEDAVTPKEMHHIVRLLKYTEETNSIIVKPLEFFHLLKQVQQKYISLGLYEQCNMFSEFAVRQIKHVYEDEGPETLHIFLQYGISLSKCGSLTEAELLVNDVYINQLKHFNEPTAREKIDEDFHYTKGVMATIWQQKGKYDEALKMYLEVLEVSERVLGIDDPNTLTVKYNIAETHGMKRNYDEALKILLEVLEVEQRVTGIDHPNTLTTRSTIAGIHDGMGNYDEALEIYLEVLEIRERVLGIEHPNTLITKGNMASAYESKGNYDAALKQYLEVLRIQERVLGIDHPYTLTTKRNMGATHSRKENHDEALKIYLEVLEDEEQVLGIDHPATLTTRYNIAMTHESKGNFDEALKMYLEVLEAEERVLGIDHPSTLATKNNIAYTYAIKGNYDAALKIFLEVLETQERVIGIDHPSILTTKQNIARTHHKKGNYDQALKMCIEVLEAQERVVGIDHPNTFTTKNYIAEIHDSIGNYNEALKIYLEFLDAQKMVVGVDHISTLTTLCNIAGTHESNGDYDKALKMYLEVLQTQERVLGIDHPCTLITRNNTA